MTEEQLQRAKAVYEMVAGRDPSERAALLDEACADDPEIRAEVEELLSFLPESGDFIEHPPLSDPSLFESIAQSLDSGRLIGNYKVLEEIGRGGMGAVYLAVRADDEFSKQVAIKLVWPGFDSAEVVRRFKQERQILADLDHPNIARLLDGGTTEEGWPYVVMEYVDGLPITEYCDERQLSINQRLKLFEQVCAAVQYAHRNLVVHRDLKPGNIFVTRDGAVKLLDFGIAKILDPSLRADGLSLTHTGLLAMTPEYASPEQARGENITTASDVYSLGVTLYELLTGVHPFRFKTRVLHEMLRTICEEEPARPSLVWSAALNVRGTAPGAVESGWMGEVNGASETGRYRPRRRSVFARKGSSLPPEGGAPNPLSNAHENTPDKLSRRLRGDLDNIILKAMRKEPAQRYDSVEQLSQDIARHLAGEPVIAREPTFHYRARKYARRNKARTAFAVFVVVLMIGVTAFSLWQWRTGMAEARENYHALYAARMNQAVQDREDFNVRGIRKAVESSLPQPGEEDLRGFEWYYLWRWYNRDLITLPQDEPVWYANVIENSSMVFTNGPTSANRTTKIWDAQTGKLLYVLKSGDEATNPVFGFLPGGFVVQGVGKRAFKVWQLSTGKDVTPVIDTLSTIASNILSCTGSEDYRGCQLFTASEDGTIKGWDLATAKLLCTIKTSAPVRFWALSLKYQRLVVYVGGNRLQFWDLATPRLIADIDEPAPRTTVDLEAGSQPPDVRGLLYVRDSVVKRFDWSTGRELQKIELDRPLGGRTGTRGGKFFSFGGNSEVQIVDWLMGRHVGELKGHRDLVQFVDAKLDGSIAATGSSDQTVRLWDLRTWRQLAVIPAHEREVFGARFIAGDRKLITASTDHTAKIWDVASLLTPDTLESHTRGIFSVAFSPDGSRLATAGQDRTVKLWDVQTGKLLNTLVGHEHDIFKIAFSPSGERLASASEDFTVRIWDAKTGEQIKALSDFTVRPRAVAFSPDGKLLAVGSDYAFANRTDDRTIRIWDLATFREVMAIKGHRGDVVSLDFSPDSKRLASASGDNTARIWDLATGRELVLFNGHKEPVWSARFSPDGHRLATGSADQTVRVWDAATGKELLPPLKGHSAEVFGVAFSPDGKRLASASKDRTLKLWDAATGRDLVTFNDHQNQVWSVAFSPDGRTMASGSWDKTARLWRAATAQEVEARLRR